jgi:hypothetical protein
VDQLIKERLLRWSLDYWLNRFREQRCLLACISVANLHHERTVKNKALRSISHCVQLSKMGASRL